MSKINFPGVKEAKKLSLSNLDSVKDILKKVITEWNEATERALNERVEAVSGDDLESAALDGNLLQRWEGHMMRTDYLWKGIPIMSTYYDDEERSFVISGCSVAKLKEIREKLDKLYQTEDHPYDSEG